MTRLDFKSPGGSPAGIRATLFALAIMATVALLPGTRRCFAQIMAQGPPSEPPERPTGLTGDVKHNQVALTWDHPDDDSITGYQILRRDTRVHELGEFIIHVDGTGSSDASYTDDTVEADARYVYRVKARNAAGLSPRSDYFTAQTPPPPAVVVSFGQATYSVTEGETVTVSVTLDIDPERTVEISIVAANQSETSDDDYSISATSVTFNASETSQDITLTATDDADSVSLTFGTLPSRVSEGNVSTATLSITDNDEPPIDPVNSPATGAPTVSGTARVERDAHGRYFGHQRRRWSDRASPTPTSGCATTAPTVPASKAPPVPHTRRRSGTGVRKGLGSHCPDAQSRRRTARLGTPPSPPLPQSRQPNPRRNRRRRDTPVF